MGNLWTPSGGAVPEPEHRAGTSEISGSASDPASQDHPAPQADPDEAAWAEELRRTRAELAATQVADIIANHVIGLWQLAVLHLTPEDGNAPRLDEAGLALDAMAGLVESLGDRLGPHSEPLREALAQLRLAFVQIQDRRTDD